MYEATFSEYLELTRRERALSERRRKLHKAIDGGDPTELMLKLERSVSAERRALHREIDARRAQLWPPAAPPKNRRLAHAPLAALWPRKRPARQTEATLHSQPITVPDSKPEQQRAPVETPAIDADPYPEPRREWVTRELGDNWVEVTPGIYEYAEDLP